MLYSNEKGSSNSFLSIRDTKDSLEPVKPSFGSCSEKQRRLDDLDAQIRDATDSLRYKELSAERDRLTLEVKVASCAGCLIGELRNLGANSKTPYECPVDDCSVGFDNNTLRANDPTACQNPKYAEPVTPKYK